MLNERDKYHAASVAPFGGFDGVLGVSSLIVTEVCYLAQAQVGPEAEAKFIVKCLDGGEAVANKRIRQHWRMGDEALRSGCPSCPAIPRISRAIPQKAASGGIWLHGRETGQGHRSAPEQCVRLVAGPGFEPG